MSANSLDEAAAKMTGSTYANNQCIMVMVRASYGCCCCDLKFDVPANFMVLEEEWGESTGLMNPGA